MIPSIGPLELVVVLAIALIILGPKRLPDAGKSLGRGMREFKDSLTGGGSDDTDLLVVDGPLRNRRQLPRTIGYVKTQQKQYLPAALTAVVEGLSSR